MRITKNTVKGSIIAASMGILILDSKTAFAGAADGITLCLHTVIPALLPFFVISGIMLSGKNPGFSKLLRPLGRICGVPIGSESLLLLGLIGGYPVGAQAIDTAYRNGQLQKYDAQRLLGFCNNAGPSFIFGLVAAQFSASFFPWLIWLIHLASALLVGLCLPGKSKDKTLHIHAIKLPISAILDRSLQTMARVCGWVIMSRVLINVFLHWLWFPAPIYWEVWVTGILELTNGCCILMKITDEALRFLICNVLLSLGGLCVFLQTLSVTNRIGLGWYIPGKLLQTLFSVFLSCMVLPILSPSHCYSYFLLAIAALGIIVLTMVLLKRKK